MEARDLRLNNWVNYEGKPYRIWAIDHEMPHLDTEAFGTGVVSWNKLEPIPITPEILEKAGFDFDQITYDCGCGIWLAPNEVDYTAFLGTLSKPIPRSIKYVHELQNLIFALTGTELNIQL